MLSEAILEYYHQRRAAWGNPPADDPLFPEITERKQLAGMYSLLSVVVHDPDSSEPDTVGLLFDCTWEDAGIGVRMNGCMWRKSAFRGRSTDAVCSGDAERLSEYSPKTRRLLVQNVRKSPETPQIP